MFEKYFKDSSANMNAGDYLNAQGLLICGKCREAKECYIEYPAGSGKQIKKTTPCRCDIAADEEYQKRKAQEDFQDRILELRRQGVTDEVYTSQRFESDDRRNPDVTEACLKYVKKWEQMKENRYGITFTGAVGGGKSFYACCIANALIDRGVRVLVTRLSDLVRNRVQDKSSDIDLREFELIVLDDIGVEGATQTAYNIADDIYRAGIPLIITTNLSLPQLAESQPIEKQRIYTRIIERASMPIKVDVKISRLDIAKQNAARAQKILYSKD